TPWPSHSPSLRRLPVLPSPRLPALGGNPPRAPDVSRRFERRVPSRDVPGLHLRGPSRQRALRRVPRRRLLRPPPGLTAPTGSADIASWGCGYMDLSFGHPIALFVVAP
uniref:Uncharacterized protein n=1 Tax=Aegilops tauschii subsp. strangulata TaxID=200361 RepID=A0A453GS67_AEGTS